MGSSEFTFPGVTVQWRVVLSYAGSNTSVFALGSVLYQPTFSNVDNVQGFGGVDSFAPWRNGGQQGNAIAGSMLSAADGANGGALPSYGRVVYGGTAMHAPSFNTLTTFRHGGDAAQAGAPTGQYLRVAGSSVTNWPLASLSGPDATADALNAINRGVISNQQAWVNPITGLTNTSHVSGTQNLVLFRGAFSISGSFDRPALVTLSIAPGSQARVGGIGNADDTRFITWQTNSFDAGSWRTGFTVQDATIFIPTPGVTVLAAVTSCLVLRRRR